MRKVIITLAVLAIALAFVPSTAAPAPNPIPNSCLIAGGEATDGTGSVHCEFETAATGLHGYVGLIPNDFVIWLDANNNNAVNAGETVLAEVSPSAPDPVAMAGQLDVADGAKVDVLVMEGCVQAPGCGWVGALLVG
jgi:hypothetical protein